ncbi:transglutaminase family protein [Sphingobium sufflavum]|uniref:transglutaminase-like domain-containing protein n=1 Tax=Sphingobium sufflavum TaxID=1129547 RepID=UPI001F376AE5|nr:transglutaminase family protein [Sphingobium sufflavum]MCE7795701.1 transglutaminase family protein [Sphingobium sufflavum]
MLIRAGYSIRFECEVPTPMLAMLSIHPSRNKDLVTPHHILTLPQVPIYDYHDAYGNVCSRVTVPPGGFTLSCEFTMQDSGQPDPATPDAVQHPIEDLPDEALLYLLGSRYCETDRLSETAWSLFGHIQSGWEKVQAIAAFTHGHIEFGYHHARSNRTAWDAYQEQRGVCRDFAHLAVTLCRCMNIPARYCTGYLGDIGVPPADAPMDFSAWFEVWLGDAWHVFDARHRHPRIGRILMARGRDATDTALTTSFGNMILSQFEIVTEEVRVG